jgi:type IV secretion system protein TrbL
MNAQHSRAARLWRRATSTTLRQRADNMRALLGIALLIVCSAAAAATDLHDATRSFDGLLDLVQQKAGSWNAALRGFAEKLFWLLATLQLFRTFFPMLFKQADFGGIFAELIRYLLTIGFFYFLLLNSVPIAEAIINSFRQAGAAASGTGLYLHPGEIFGLGVELAKMVGDAMTLNPATATMIAISTVIILLSFTFIAAFMQVTLIEAYLVINIAVFFMGFGGSQWTRDYALSMLKYALAVGAKLLVLTLLISLVMMFIADWRIAYKHDETSMWTLAGMSFVLAYLAKRVTELLEGLITGVSPGGGNIVGSMAAAAVAGGVAGAAAASQVGKAMLGSSGISSVADSIKSSLSGRGSSGGASSGPMNFASAGGGSSAGPGPRAGGGGFSVPKSSPSSSGAAASPAQGAKSSAASMAHTATSAAVRTGGALADLAVPGMEGVADLSLPEPPRPTDSGMPDVPDTPENVIRPASETNIDTMSSLQEALNKRGSKA